MFSSYILLINRFYRTYKITNRKGYTFLHNLFPTTKSIKSIGNHSYDSLILYHGIPNIATEFHTATCIYSPLSFFSNTYSDSLPKNNSSEVLSHTRILPSLSNMIHVSLSHQLQVNM